MKKADLNKLLETASAAVVAFGQADNNFREAMRNAAILTVRVIVDGKQDAEKTLELAKASYGYEAKDKQGQQSFRTWAKFVRGIADRWSDIPEQDREEFLAGRKPASTLFSEATKPERDAKSAANKADKEAAEAVERERIERLEAAAGRVATPAEMMVHVAAYLDSLPNVAKLRKGEARALASLMDSMTALRERVAATAAKPKAETPARLAA
jgi:hypothetical protein